MKNLEFLNFYFFQRKSSKMGIWENIKIHLIIFNFFNLFFFKIHFKTVVWKMILEFLFFLIFFKKILYSIVDILRWFFGFWQNHIRILIFLFLKNSKMIFFVKILTFFIFYYNINNFLNGFIRTVIKYLNFSQCWF